MTPQELKNSILQLAIQGKLVEQRPEEGTATELLRDILTQRRRDAEVGRSPRDRRVSARNGGRGATALPPIPDAEKPFDIPESWEWVRLGEIAESIQYGYSAPARQSGRIRMIRISDIQNGKINWETVPFCDILENDIGRYLVESGDILFARTGGTVGKSYLVRDVPQESLYAGYLIRTRFLKCVLPQYAKTFFESDIYWKQLKDGLIATAQPNFNGKKLALMLIPLPPLAEQKRIVAKIEELMPLVDRYEKAWSRLEDFNKRFPVDMQKSLLQMAIQGKLVEQKADEGTGAELLEKILAAKNAEGARGKGEKSHAKSAKSAKVGSRVSREEIPDDEKPFDIPESWEWARLGVVVDVRDGTHDTPKYVQAGVPLVTSKNLVSGTIDFTNAKFISYEDSKAINIRSGVDDGDVLFAMIGTIGNPVLIRKDREFSIKNMALFKPIDRGLFCMEYLMMFLTKAQFDMRKSASASVQSFVSLSFLRNYPIPLPPLAEQKRIVAKLEELLPLCERLKSESNSAANS